MTDDEQPVARVVVTPGGRCVVSVKPRYRLILTTELYYHFWNAHTSGLQRETYTILRSEFWGRRAR